MAFNGNGAKSMIFSDHEMNKKTKGFKKPNVKVDARSRPSLVLPSFKYEEVNKAFGCLRCWTVLLFFRYVYNLLITTIC